MNPEPVGGIAANGNFKGTVHVQHDGFRRAGLAVFVDGNFVAHFNAPMTEAGAITNGCMQRKTVAHGKYRRRFGGGTIMAEERNTHAAIASVLVGEETEN